VLESIGQGPAMHAIVEPLNGPDLRESLLTEVCGTPFEISSDVLGASESYRLDKTVSKTSVQRRIF
jgi:hypothetical protein